MNADARAMMWALALLALAPRSAAAEPATIVHKQARTFGPEERVQDLVAVEAVVELSGVVRGHLFAVDSTIIVRSKAVILESITLQRGALQVEAGAVMPKDVLLYGASAAGIEAEIKPAATSSASLALMRAFLPFDRFVPPEGVRLEALGGGELLPGLAERKADSNLPELVVGGIARLKVVSDQVRASLQLGYVGGGRTVLVSALALKDEPSARALWSELEASAQGKKLGLSFRSALGEGVHWSYRVGGADRARTVLLWQRGAYLLAIEARTPGAPADEQALVLEVAQALRQRLLAAAADKKTLTRKDEGAPDAHL